MGAGGRHWELLVQKFRASACAAVEAKTGAIQHGAEERQDSQEAEDPGSDQELLKGEGEGSESGTVQETDLLLEEPDKVKVTGTISKEELGRSTWTFLHTLAAQFPQKPTKQQQRDAKELMAIISRLYPCKTCAEHFKEVLKAKPPKTNSGIELAEWVCQVHNVVNKSLGKPEFPCEQVDFRWGAFDCNGACDLHAGPPHY